MKKKKQFIRPEILLEMNLQGDKPILEGSVADDVTIVSTGQAVENHDFSGTEFNHQWE